MALSTAASGATPGGEFPSFRRILCLSDSPLDDPWLMEIEERLNEESGSAPFIVIRRAVTGDEEGFLDNLLDSYAPALVVSRQSLSESAKRGLVARTLPLLGVPASSGSARATARRILDRLGRGRPEAASSREARLRAQFRAHLEFAGHSGAEAALQNIHVLAPEDPEVLVELIRLRRLTRPWGALVAADRLAALPGRSDAQRADDLIVSAALRSLVGDSASAERDYASALKFRPESSAALLGLAQEKRARPLEALHYATRAAAPPGARAEAHRVVAEIHLDLGNHAAAQESLLRAQAASPDDIDTLALMARAMSGQPAAASAYAARAVAVAEKTPLWHRPDAYRLCARIWLELGDSDQAAILYQRALTIDPDDLNSLQALSRLRRDRRQPPPALKGDPEQEPPSHDLSEAAILLALKANPDDLEALSQLLTIRREQGELREASALAKRFHEAVSAAPPWLRLSAYRLLWQLAWDAGDPARAWLAATEREGWVLDELRLRMRPGAGTLEYVAAEVLVAAARAELGDEAGAEKGLRRMLEHFPDDLYTLRALRELKTTQRRFAEALAFAERLEKADTAASPRERAAAYAHKAQLQRELKDEAGAEKSLRKALRLSDEWHALPVMIQLMMSQARFGEALTYAKRLDKAGIKASSRQRAAAYAQKAQIQFALKDEAGAEQSLREALSISDEGPALPMMFDLALSRRRFAEALSYAERLERVGAHAPPRERAQGYARKAQIQLELKDEAGAEKSLREALSLSDEGPALPQLFRLALSRRQFAEALSYAERLQKAAATPRERAEALMRTARIQLELKNEAGAQKNLREALSLAEERLVSAEDYAWKAQIQLELKDGAGAEISLRKALRLSDKGSALSMLLHLTISQRRYAEALTLAERLEKAAAGASPRERAAALAQKARIKLELKDEAGAEKSLREALTFMGEGSALAEDYEQKARIQLELKDEAGAEESLRAALSLSGDGPALAMMIQVMMSQRRFAEALPLAERLEKAGAQAPARERADDYARKARIQIELKDEAGAESSLKRALAAAPDDLDILWTLFDAKSRNPREALGVVAARKPVEARGKAAWLALRGHARAGAQDQDGARRDIAASVKMDPQGICFGALFERRRGRLDPRYFDRCLELFPANPTLYSDRGVARYRAGRQDEALTDFRKAIELEPGHLAGHINLLSLLTAQARDAKTLAAADAAADAAVNAAKDKGSPVLSRILEIQADLRRAQGRPEHSPR